MVWFRWFAVESTSQLEKSCANGPEYWCETIESSKKCNAFKFCMQTVWTKHAKYMDKVLTADNAECHSCLECISGDFKVDLNNLNRYIICAWSLNFILFNILELSG